MKGNDWRRSSQEYISKINNVREKHNIPDTLIINWDQTGCQLVPGGDWTMEKEGTQQISISGLDDKRQITLLLAVSMSGDLLPPQLIYPGKTDRCLPKGVDFPSTWDVTCTETHWSNEDTMMQFVNKVIVPYVDEIRDSMPLNNSTTQKAIAIFDVFKAHRGERLLNLLKDNDIVPLFVPAACTDRLQPLDLSVNREYKEQLKSHFHDWYSAEVIHQINEQEDSTGEIAPDNVVVNMRTSVLKPIHANWIVSSHNKMSTRENIDKDLATVFDNIFPGASPVKEKHYRLQAKSVQQSLENYFRGEEVEFECGKFNGNRKDMSKIEVPFNININPYLDNNKVEYESDIPVFKLLASLHSFFRYKDFIPASIGKRICLATKADGNCIFNAFSIALYGDEGNAHALRLHTIVTMADKVMEYSKYITEEFGENAATSSAAFQVQNILFQRM
ncbi:unnamed protein product [Mytilus edulis]|uniref:DDE-1 domain-containing protein n=1 Tax=Mytilus edulis TaxID=6550 RepID=A0A8S3Q8Y9_MYTED|nr:unnamed protein product [Mytilus edulis]